MKGYDPEELEHCRSKDCPLMATVIVLKTMKPKKHSPEEGEILIGYCSFHAMTANVFFGENPQRKEVKGIRPC